MNNPTKIDKSVKLKMQVTIEFHGEIEYNSMSDDPGDLTINWEKSITESVENFINNHDDYAKIIN